MNSDISCLLCVYINDDLPKFKKALDSILNQTLKPNEVIIVVDGPVKLSVKEFLISLDDSFIKIIWNIANLGHGNARRLGVEFSNCKYISIFDADDLSYPNRLFLSFAFLEENSSVGVVSGLIRECWDDNIITYRNCQNINFKYSNPVNQNSCTIRRSAYLDSGGYVDWYHNEDTYLWTRMLIRGWGIGYINHLFTDVYLNIDSLSRRRGLRYFKSEILLRKYMYNNNLLTLSEFVVNILLRIITQLIFPKELLKFVFIWRRKKL